jgi:hypothetical protein
MASFLSVRRLSSALRVVFGEIRYAGSGKRRRRIPVPRQRWAQGEWGDTLRTRTIRVIVSVAVTAALVIGGTTCVAASTPQMSPGDYLDRALDLLAANALNSSQVDWPAVRARTHAMITGAKTPTDAYPAIRFAITALHDKHTMPLAPATITHIAAAPEFPGGLIVANDIAYIRLPAVWTTNGQRYWTVGDSVIKALDAHRPRGWIVDLRDNWGGDMYPMIDTVAPLISEGPIGSFADHGEDRVMWLMRRDGLTVGGFHYPLPANPYRLPHPAGPIAVLTDADTASSGEATLIAFRGQSNARTFGSPTAGYASANEVFKLSDGAELLITETDDCDRTGQEYGENPITPDQSTSSADHATLGAATQWIDDAAAASRQQP